MAKTNTPPLNVEAFGHLLAAAGYRAAPFNNNREREAMYAGEDDARDSYFGTWANWVNRYRATHDI